MHRWLLPSAPRTSVCRRFPPRFAELLIFEGCIYIDCGRDKTHYCSYDSPHSKRGCEHSNEHQKSAAPRSMPDETTVSVDCRRYCFKTVAHFKTTDHEAITTVHQNDGKHSPSSPQVLTDRIHYSGRKSRTVYPDTQTVSREDQCYSYNIM